MTTVVATYSKDPDATLDFIISWAEWLNSGEALSSSAWSVVSGDVTIESDESEDGINTALISGGTVDTFAYVKNSVVSDAGREDDRTIAIWVRQQ